ncbi:hypothetical protein FHG87_009349 [Trinorchestia longiramus]|nr:hypothetical protein FHG87_009349 [Trinorchestia longiramus]
MFKLFLTTEKARIRALSVSSYLIKYAIPMMNQLTLSLLPLLTTISLAQVFPITLRDVGVEGLVIVQTAKSVCEYPVKVCPLLYA